MGILGGGDRERLQRNQGVFENNRKLYSTMYPTDENYKLTW